MGNLRWSEVVSVDQTMRRLHVYALFVAVLAMGVMIAGATITSAEVAARESQSAVALIPSDGLHRSLGIALALLTLGLAIWASLGAIPRWIRIVAWTGVVALVSDSALAWQALPLSPKTGVLHALLAHLYLSVSVVVAVGTSRSWNREPELVDGSIRPLLRPLVIAIAPVVFLDITLGAAYRHDMTSVMPHMAVAMGVAFLALIGSSSHPAKLSPAGIDAEGRDCAHFDRPDSSMSGDHGVLIAGAERGRARHISCWRLSDTWRWERLLSQPASSWRCKSGAPSTA